MSPAHLGPGDALLIVDVQVDFLPGGALPVPGGDAVIAPLNHYVAHFHRRGLPVYATRDWHPADHGSFRTHGGTWPTHCVQHTPGAELAATLRASPLDAFFSVALPLAWPGFVSAAVLSFAHTIGEFGMVLMMGGNIPGQTRVLSTQIYGHVETMAYTQAHILAAGMLVFSFAVLLGLNLLQKRGLRLGA